MTSYTVKHFSYAVSSGGIALLCEEGLFQIDDPDLARALQFISTNGVKFIQSDELFFKQFFGSKSETTSAIEYLIDTVKVLQRATHQFKWLVMSPNKTWLDIADTYYPISGFISELVGIHTDKSSALTVLFSDFTTRDEIKRIAAGVSKQGVMSFAFPVHDKYIITDFWSRQSGAACPCCVYDFVSGNSYDSDSGDTSSVSNIARQLGLVDIGSVPLFRPTPETLFGVLSILSTRLAVMNGSMPAGAYRSNIFEAASVSYDSTSPRFFRAPISPNCDCL